MKKCDASDADERPANVNKRVFASPFQVQGTRDGSDVSDGDDSAA